MDNNIYNIDSWASSTNYYKHKIITTNNLYYYASLDHTSSSSFSTDLSNGKWNGYITHNNENKPYFTWSPSYRHTTESQPKIKKIQFGDSYTQRVNDGINNILPSINLTFDNISIEECSAILHFLEQRAGTESFVFIPPQPRNIIGRYICEEWNDIRNFYNNYTISAKFDRTPV